MKDSAHHLKQVQRKVIQKERQSQGELAPPPVAVKPPKAEKVHVSHPKQNIYRIRVDVH